MERRENLSDVTHTLRISVGRGQQNAIVDGLMQVFGRTK